ncbi:MAG: Endopeptidase La, partial [Thermodesulfobacteriota bacterium]|nr:Endopeptidase La [Thermodesulfobacteriota bacterium]
MTDKTTTNDLKIIHIPETLPILPLFNMIVFPKMMLPMEVLGEQSLQLVDEAMAKDRIIGLVLARKSPPDTTYQVEDFYTIGTSAVILKMAKTAENKAQLLVQGIERFHVRELVAGKPYLQARIESIQDQETKGIEVEALMANLVVRFERIVKLTPLLPQEFGSMAKTITDPGILADLIASIINVPTEEKQAILELIEVKQRLREVTRLVNHQVEILELGNKIQSQVKDDMDKSQRDYYLRQQLGAIKKELGEEDETKVEVDEYREKLAKKDLPAEAKKEADRELQRLDRMHPSS